MGVPALFRWLSQKYPKIISPVIEENSHEVDGEEVPVDTTGPNPNGEEMDNLYLDMNGIVHPCSHPEDRPPPATEEEMMLEIFKYTDRVVNMVRPRKLLMIAVDGVAPRAKQNQQRSRRFRSAQEAKEMDEQKEEYYRRFQSKSKENEDADDAKAVPTKTWDSNAITPGTPFMDILAASLRYWCAYKLNTDPAWAKMKVIISDATVPGEGEHKIMQFVRSQRQSPDHDPNTRHVIYGLDADLIMLGLATHEPHFRVLREDVFFQESKARTCHLCGQKGHKAEECRGAAKKKEGTFDEKNGAVAEKPFIWLHVSILREYLAAELHVPSQSFRFDLERALDDWVFMCFFVGNDFLPHLPSLDIRENGIDTLITIWRENISAMGGYVTKDGEVNLERAQYIMNDLAKQENAIFRRRRKTEENREAGAKRRKLENENRSRGRGQQQNSPSNGGGRGPKQTNVPDPMEFPLFTPGNITKEAKAMTHDMVVNRGAIFRANEANKSAAAALKSRLLGSSSSAANDSDPATAESGGDLETSKDAEIPHSALGKRKAELIDGEDGNDTSTQGSPSTPQKADNEPAPDTVRLWEEGYADRYYEQKFKVEASNIDFRHQVAAAYVEGLAWVLKYYFQGCPSWNWYYPYHYAPFAADFQNLAALKISFDKGKPFRPFEQLMGVMPAASKHTLPKVFHSLMEDDDSEIIDFYPQDFEIDLNGKKMAWQGVALLPWIDEKRLLDAMAKVYPLLSAEDAARNGVGKDVLLISDGHPLYDEITSNFYSKKQGAPNYKLNAKVSEGLAGKIEKDESVLPWGTLSFPLSDGGMPDIDSDKSLSVNYEMPRFDNPHKSMLLRGVQEQPPALNQIDIEVTRNRAGRPNRDYGGNSSRGHYGNGRGRGRGQNNYNSGPPQPPSGNFGFPLGAGGPPSWPPPPGFPPINGFGNGPPAPPPPPGVAGYRNDSGYIPPPPGYGPPPLQIYRGQGSYQNGYQGNRNDGNQRSYGNGGGRNWRN